MQHPDRDLRQTLEALRRRVAEQKRGPAQVLPPEVLLRMLTESARGALRRAGPGWHPDSDVTVHPGNGPPVKLELVSFKRIDVAINIARLQERCAELAKCTPTTQPVQLAADAVSASVVLWAGHYDYCPFDAWRHNRLCDSAAEGGFETLHLSLNQWRIANAVACFFERSTVARVLSQKEGSEFARGTINEHLVNKRPAGLLTDLFLQSQSLLAPRIWKQELQRYPVGNDPMTDGFLPDVLRLIFGVRLRAARAKRRLRSIPGGSPRQRDWADRVRQLARLLIPYLDDPAPQSETPFPQPFGNNTNPHGSGAQTGSISFAPIHAPQDSFALDPTGSQCSTPRVAGGPQAGRSSRPIRRLDFDQMDRYYSENAPTLPVEPKPSDNRKTRKPECLTVGFLDSEPAGLAALASGNIDWFGLRVRRGIEGHELIVRKRIEPLELPIDGDGPSGAGPPHLLLIVDSSGSMRFDPSNPNRAARGKYDVVLTAAYGIFAHIEQRGFSGEVQVACINFSRGSIESGWHSFSDIDRIKKVLFQYQGGGTQLSPLAIRRAFESRPADFLTIMITDGCLANVPEAAGELERTVRAGCDLVLLHVGVPNAFTQAAEGMGGRVYIVQDARDLIGLSLQIAERTYIRSRP